MTTTQARFGVKRSNAKSVRRAVALRATVAEVEVSEEKPKPKGKKPFVKKNVTVTDEQVVVGAEFKGVVVRPRARIRSPSHLVRASREEERRRVARRCRDARCAAPTRRRPERRHYVLSHRTRRRTAQKRRFEGLGLRLSTPRRRARSAMLSLSRESSLSSSSSFETRAPPRVDAVARRRRRESRVTRPPSSTNPRPPLTTLRAPIYLSLD